MMKPILYMLMATLILGSCQNEATEQAAKDKAIKMAKDSSKFVNVTVSMDSVYSEFVDFPSIIGVGRKRMKTKVEGQNIAFVFDSVPKGKIAISVFSLLTVDFRKFLNVQADTVVAIDSKFYKHCFIKDAQKISHLKFDDEDTIFISQRLKSEAGEYFVKLMISSFENDFMVRQTTHGPRDFGMNDFGINKGVKNVLKKFVQSCEQLYNQPKQNEAGQSFKMITYIRKGDTIYALPGLNTNKWKAFDELRSKLCAQPYTMERFSDSH
jgi:hypothetical protein